METHNKQYYSTALQKCNQQNKSKETTIVNSKKAYSEHNNNQQGSVRSSRNKFKRTNPSLSKVSVIPKSPKQSYEKVVEIVPKLQGLGSSQRSKSKHQIAPNIPIGNKNPNHIYSPTYRQQKQIIEANNHNKKAVNFTDRTNQKTMESYQSKGKQRQRYNDNKKPSQELRLFVSPPKAQTSTQLGRHVQRQSFQMMDDTKSNRSISKYLNSTTHRESEEYYVYWKKKAYEYLQKNIELSNQINALKKQINSFNYQSDKNNTKKNNEKQQEILKGLNQTSFAINQIQYHQYMQKIKNLETQVKVRDIKVNLLQGQIVQFAKKIQTQQEKTKLLELMRIQIQQLKRQNEALLNSNANNNRFSEMQNQKRQRSLYLAKKRRDMMTNRKKPTQQQQQQTENIQRLSDQ